MLQSRVVLMITHQFNLVNLRIENPLNKYTKPPRSSILESSLPRNFSIENFKSAQDLFLEISSQWNFNVFYFDAVVRRIDAFYGRNIYYETFMHF